MYVCFASVWNSYFSPTSQDQWLIIRIICSNEGDFYPDRGRGEEKGRSGMLHVSVVENRYICIPFQYISNEITYFRSLVRLSGTKDTKYYVLDHLKIRILSQKGISGTTKFYAQIDKIASSTTTPPLKWVLLIYIMSCIITNGLFCPKYYFLNKYHICTCTTQIYICLLINIFRQ